LIFSFFFGKDRSWPDFPEYPYYSGLLPKTNFTCKGDKTMSLITIYPKTIDGKQYNIVKFNGNGIEMFEDLYKLFDFLNDDNNIKSLFIRSSKRIFIGSIKYFEDNPDKFECFVLKTDENKTYEIGTALYGFKSILSNDNNVKKSLFIDKEQKQVYFVSPSSLYTLENFNEIIVSNDKKIFPKYSKADFHKLMIKIKAKEFEKGVSKELSSAVDYFVYCRNKYKKTVEVSYKIVLKKYAEYGITKEMIAKQYQSRISYMRWLKP
jgi:hypothetical protein